MTSTHEMAASPTGPADGMKPAHAQDKVRGEHGQQVEAEEGEPRRREEPEQNRDSRIDGELKGDVRPAIVPPDPAV
ncbi:MAG: hypothetical protein LBT40_16905 [Deltaproteobacteria bacterium]|jgi:hypothetical protein|nr:hypothetical protein [Deltaproteobacteria bacterium]